MYRLRSIALAGPLILGFHFSVLFSATASECPCKRIGPDVCIPDKDCEARERLRIEHEIRRLPRQGTESAPQAPASAPAIHPSITADRPARPAALPPPQQAAPPRVGAAPAPPPLGAAPPPPPAASAARARLGSSPPKAQPPSAVAASLPAGPRPRILETGYSVLAELGKEESGYGLYSYAILPADSARASSFLSEIFREIPSIGDTGGAKPLQLNIFYIPLRAGKEGDFATLVQTSGGNPEKLGAIYSKAFYDYGTARSLLNHICNPPNVRVRDLCDGPLSTGPYIFTYASPASRMEPVPPPFLFVDLSGVQEGAFGELLAAFKAQVKREDISDSAKIETLRLTVLQFILKGAGLINPMEKAIGDIIHATTGSADTK
jgi:hypothetical protein